MSMKRFICCFGLMVGLGFLAGTLPCRAQMQFDVSLDTSPLIGEPSGPFSLDFQFTDGNGLGDGNNSVVLSNFQFGTGGSASGNPTPGTTGDLSSTVSLKDSSFFTEFTEGITPGDVLTFHVQLTTNMDSGGVPDEFAFGILDNTGAEIPTFDIGNALLVVDIDSSTPTWQTFGADPGQTSIALPAPIISNISFVPEPTTFSLLAGMSVFGFSCRRYRRRYRMRSHPNV
jgi:hypothetical protein